MKRKRKRPKLQWWQLIGLLGFRIAILLLDFLAAIEKIQNFLK